MNEMEKLDYFYDGGLVEYMSEEQLGCVIAYIYKNFDDSLNSSVQLNNCVNLVNYIRRHNLTIGDVEADKLLERSIKLRNMFNVLNNADILVRVSAYPELKELYDLYCIKNDVIVGRDADYGCLEHKYGKKDLDLIRLYFEDIARYKLLTAEEEKELCIKVKNGDEEARKKLIEHNLRLVVSIAKRYVNPAVSLDDLIQFGSEGLITASRKFDIDKGYKFSTYATHWIRQAVTRGIVNTCRTIRIPAHVYECINKIKKVQTEYLLTNGDYPNVNTLCELTGYNEELVNRCLEYMDTIISLSTTINEDEDTTLADIIEDESSSLDNIGDVTDKVALQTIFDIAALGERDMYIIKARNGFFGRVYTLQEIGEKFGLTRERVRQLEIKALKKLKTASKRRDFSRICQYNMEKNDNELALARMM